MEAASDDDDEDITPSDNSRKIDNGTAAEKSDQIGSGNQANKSPLKSDQKVAFEKDDSFPPSFSKIQDPENPDFEKFPLFRGVPSQRVVLTAGQALYLPAGWFHHVTSRGGLHMAINYWFHPPPYPDQLVEEQFQRKVEQLKMSKST